jgi:hypothetical protein
MLFSTLLPITLSQKTRNFLVRCGDPHPMRLSDVFGDSSFFRYWVAGVARIGLFIEPRRTPGPSTGAPGQARRGVFCWFVLILEEGPQLNNATLSLT